MVAFVSSIVGALLMTGIALLVARRRPPGTPLTWGEAFVAATFVFFTLMLVYGVVPNQWLRWADNELQWRKDAYLVSPTSKAHKYIKIVITKEALRDVIATGLYAAGLVAHFWLWAWWQRRGKVKPAETPQSAFGRPLLRAAPEDAELAGSTS